LHGVWRQSAWAGSRCSVGMSRKSDGP
jgi:hypothetical protein